MNNESNKHRLVVQLLIFSLWKLHLKNNVSAWLAERFERWNPWWFLLWRFLHWFQLSSLQHFNKLFTKLDFQRHLFNWGRVLRCLHFLNSFLKSETVPLRFLFWYGMLLVFVVHLIPFGWIVRKKIFSSQSEEQSPLYFQAEKRLQILRCSLKRNLKLEYNIFF